MTLIDRYLPLFDYREYHERSVAAGIDHVYDIVRHFRFANSAVTDLLLRLRGFPPGTLSLQTVLDAGFILLDERPNDEFVIGLVGKFWTPSGCLLRMSPEEFVNFRTEGFAKAAWNFRFFNSSTESTVVSTETRIYCLDARSRRFFSFYWFFIRPFSGLIRSEMLRSIKRSVQR